MKKSHILLLITNNVKKERKKMKCINCGKKSNALLCDKCHTIEILDKMFSEMLGYKEEICENKYLKEYASQFENPYLVRDHIPELLEGFSDEDTEFYYCHFCKVRRIDEYRAQFEELAEKYLTEHEEFDDKKQQILYDIISFYLRDEFVKPQKWCEMIYENKNLKVELYDIAAEFFGMIAEYKKSEELVKRALDLIKEKKDNYIFASKEGMERSLEKQKDLLVRYKNQKPYWPSTEERRRALAPIYDAKKIEHPPIEIGAKGKDRYERGVVIRESEFKPIEEFYGDLPKKYIIFWCNDTFNIPAIRCIYEIAAIRVESGKIVDKFQSFVKPWDGKIAREKAAKLSSMSIEKFSDDIKVEKVIAQFMKFIKEDLLVSTNALGNQGKILVRALRYSGISEIKNKFWDILDYAADTDTKFDLENNNREYLLEHFKLKEGKDALEKTRVSLKLIEKLKEMNR